MKPRKTAPNAVRATVRAMARRLYDDARSIALTHPTVLVRIEDLVRQYNVILEHARRSVRTPESLQSLETLDFAKQPITYADLHVLLGQVMAALESDDDAEKEEA
jgi:endonuclease/exonuclease/phosphatase (EEP) superfamily protein YafD